MLKKIGVILGGNSTEREISLKSGEAIYNSLIRNGYQVHKIDPKTDDIYQTIYNNNIELIFIALHGQGGEDGTIQGMLEIMGIPYTGSDVLASALTMNKIYTQSILRDNNILVPEFITLRERDYNEGNIEQITMEISDKIGFPVLVKAPSQGSTLGIYFINKEDKSYEEQLKEAFKEAFKLENHLLIEKMITPSDEITIGLLGNDTVFPLPTLEITTVTGYYDYTSKYTKGLCEHIIPARIDSKLRNKAKEIAVDSYKILNCKGFARADFMVKGEDIYLIDINTIPGFTEMSLLPDAAKAIGIDFDQLTEYIVDMAQGVEFPFAKYQDQIIE
ncbi:MAG: D-alanine--D-alanine ligase [Fusobacteria bacterium]|nr:D-alanine--D-alanine ligase [Fusobacteriota bacterium]